MMNSTKKRKRWIDNKIRQNFKDIQINWAISSILLMAETQSKRQDETVKHQENHYFYTLIIINSITPIVRKSLNYYLVIDLLTNANEFKNIHSHTIR